MTVFNRFSESGHLPKRSESTLGPAERRTDFDTLQLLTYKDNDAEIRLDSGDRLVLRNIDIADIGVDDFIFELPNAFL